jgi:hypothetical protein
MLRKTSYNIDSGILDIFMDSFRSEETKTSINEPTGEFFYDPWILKSKYKGTVIEEVYESLPVEKGEARVIILDPRTSYSSHADIDDRYHLNIFGNKCYLIDLSNDKMYPLKRDGVWYEMDTGRLHTAANFGLDVRIQLVVRKLLLKNNLIDPVLIKINPKNEKSNRFLFDEMISPWLNHANKKNLINRFRFIDNEVTFEIEKNFIIDLENIMDDKFEVEIL